MPVTMHFQDVPGTETFINMQEKWCQSTLAKLYQRYTGSYQRPQWCYPRFLMLYQRLMCNVLLTASASSTALVNPLI